MKISQSSKDDLSHEYAEGVVILGDLDTFDSIKECRVIVFDATPEADDMIIKLKESKDLDVAFNAALEGHAEEISLSKLVEFYLDFHE